MNSSAFFSAPEFASLATAATVIRIDAQGLALAQGPLAMPLPHLGFLDLTGADAVGFLHGQLTNDVQHQTVDTVQPSAYCQAKGRMLATFLQWRDAVDGEPRITLALTRELAAPIAKRLSMFVLRAKAKVIDASAALVAFGWLGPAAAFPDLDAEGPGLPTAPWGRSQAQALQCLRLTDVASADGPIARALIVTPAERAADVWRALSASAQSAHESVWELFEVHSGIARIVPATQEQFVPQMVNFELVGGVNFKKGCYPGQEVVARSQYLGKLRRRMFLARAECAPPMPGADVGAPGATEPVGRVVNAAANGAGGTDLLVETTLAAADGALTIGATPMHLLALPYAIPAEQGAA